MQRRKTGRRLFNYAWSNERGNRANSSDQRHFQGSTSSAVLQTAPQEFPLRSAPSPPTSVGRKTVGSSLSLLPAVRRQSQVGFASFLVVVTRLGRRRLN